MTLVKICGITNIEDAIASIDAGADFLGFIFAESPRKVEIGTIKEILDALTQHAEQGRSMRLDFTAPFDEAQDAGKNITQDPGNNITLNAGNSRTQNTVKTVGVFTEESNEALRVMDECGLDYAQLHGDQSEDFAQKIGIDWVIRVARVKDQESIAGLANRQAAYYLLDTYKKGQAGGTGETFSWDLALRAKDFGKPIFLSGGLKPDNISDAIKIVRPYAVDISSGVEIAPGKKDHNKIKELIENVRSADNAS